MGWNTVRPAHSNSRRRATFPLSSTRLDLVDGRPQGLVGAHQQLSVRSVPDASRDVEAEHRWGDYAAVGR